MILYKSCKLYVENQSCFVVVKAVTWSAGRDPSQCTCPPLRGEQGGWPTGRVANRGGWPTGEGGQQGRVANRGGN